MTETITIKNNRVNRNDRFDGLNLGDRVKDSLTGFTGIVTAQVSYLTGCDQCQVLPASTDQSKINEAHWFDVERLKLVESGVVQTEQYKPGGKDMPYPEKR